MYGSEGPPAGGGIGLTYTLCWTARSEGSHRRAASAWEFSTEFCFRLGETHWRRRQKYTRRDALKISLRVRIVMELRMRKTLSLGLAAVLALPALMFAFGPTANAGGGC